MLEQVLTVIAYVVLTLVSAGLLALVAAALWLLFYPLGIIVKAWEDRRRAERRLKPAPHRQRG